MEEGNEGEKEARINECVHKCNSPLKSHTHKATPTCQSPPVCHTVYHRCSRSRRKLSPSLAE